MRKKFIWRVIVGIVGVVGGIASFVTIFVFLTDKNLPDFFKQSNNTSTSEQQTFLPSNSPNVILPTPSSQAFTDTPTPTPRPTPLPLNTEGRLGEKNLVDSISYQSFSDFVVVELSEDRMDHLLIENTSQVKVNSDYNETVVIRNCDSVIIAGSYNKNIVIADCKQIILENDAKNNKIELFDSNQTLENKENNDFTIISNDELSEYVKLITEDEENFLIRFKQIDAEMDTEAPTVLLTQAEGYKAFDAPRYCFELTFFCLDNNNNEFSSINLDKDSFIFSNFSAKIETIESSQNGIVQFVKLSDVKFKSNTSTFVIYVKGGALVDKSGNISEGHEVTMTVSSWGLSTGV